MKLLLDTHVWIWTQESPESLGPAARASLLDKANSLGVSTISTLEIARLVEAGHLMLAGRLRTWIDQALGTLLADSLPVTHDIALTAYDLPGDFHRDPADRVLVATAVVHDMHLLTADERILGYPHALSLNARA